MAAEWDAITGLFDQRALAQLIEHLGRIGKRDLVLVFGSGRPGIDSFDRYETLIADGSDADGALLDCTEAALAEAFA